MRTSRVLLLRCGLAIFTVAAHLDTALAASTDPQTAPVVVPLVNPVGEKSLQSLQPQGLFRRVVTARGAEFDDSRTGYHDIKPIGITNTFAPDTPAVYIVVEFLQSAFDIFRLVGRFILEDPDGKPVGILLHTDKAQFENEDTGGFLMMKRPPGGFPVGTYRVEIHYEAVTDMSLLTLARFKVIPTTGK